MKIKINWGLLFSFLSSAAIILMIFFGLNNTQSSIKEDELLRLKDNIMKAAINCYAIEGFYPADITYLEENYGLIIDDRYNVFYEVQASNIMPSVSVSRRGK
ncbi:MAG: hypothetical protein MR210_02410 [Erysipelotrichaceae bacterium]|nr:hypothetical protein [Erysipelotrichaceae bacterium]MDY5251190.1 hypothetical protein [Erysipelotrichaceae bacterium]